MIMGTMTKSYNNGVADAVRSIPCNTNQFASFPDMQHYLKGYLEGQALCDKHTITPSTSLSSAKV